MRPDEDYGREAGIEGMEGGPVPVPVVDLPVQHHRHVPLLHRGNQPLHVLPARRDVSLAFQRLLSVGLVRMREQELADELIALVPEIRVGLVQKAVAEIAALAERFGRAHVNALRKAAFQRQHTAFAVAFVMLPGEERHALDPGTGHSALYGAGHPGLDLRHGVEEGRPGRRAAGPQPRPCAPRSELHYAPLAGAIARTL